VAEVPHIIKIPSAQPLFTPQLCWALPIIWDTEDIHETLGTGLTLCFWLLVVIIVTTMFVVRAVWFSVKQTSLVVQDV